MQYLLEGRLCNFWACVTELEPKLGLQGGGGEVPDKPIRELTEPIRGITVQTGTKLGEPLIQWKYFPGNTQEGQEYNIYVLYMGE